MELLLVLQNLCLEAQCRLGHFDILATVLVTMRKKEHGESRRMKTLLVFRCLFELSDTLRFKR